MVHIPNEKMLKSDSCGSCGEDVCVDQKHKTGGVTDVVPNLEGTPEEMKRLVKKIDRCLLPFMVRTRERKALPYHDGPEPY